MSFPVTPESIAYSARELIRRAAPSGPLAWAGDPQCGSGETVRLTYGNGPSAEPGGGTIRIAQGDPGAWDAIRRVAPSALKWVPAQDVFPPHMALPFTDPVPVLVWGRGAEDGARPFVERDSPDSVVVHADVLAATFFMLSRWEETVSPVRDAHGRFPAQQAVAFRHGFLDRPIVDEYAMILRAWLGVLRPAWSAPPSRFSVRLSHDIDHVRRGGSVAKAARAMARLLADGDPAAAWTTARTTFRAGRDPYLAGIDGLAAASERHGFRSAFYFKAAAPGPYDSGDDPSSPEIRACMSRLLERGHEVGFHPGYDTWKDESLFALEKHRLEQAVGRRVEGGRQHYLRFEAPTTWRIWQRQGMRYDSTLGFPDHEGFRCGTCIAFKPFDVDANCEIDIEEVPLVAMDGTLRGYRHLTTVESEGRLIELAKRCQRVGGAFTLLWHNTSLDGAWRPWRDLYDRLLGRLEALTSTTP